MENKIKPETIENLFNGKLPSTSVANAPTYKELQFKIVELEVDNNALRQQVGELEDALEDAINVGCTKIVERDDKLVITHIIKDRTMWDGWTDAEMVSAGHAHWETRDE